MQNETNQNLSDMNYSIKTSNGNKVVTLENGEYAHMIKHSTYGSRYVWIVRKNRETIACGSTLKDCAANFAKKQTN